MKIGIDGRAAKWYRGTGIGNYTYQVINSLNQLDTCNNYLLFMPDKCRNDINFNKILMSVILGKTAVTDSGMRLIFLIFFIIMK